MTPVVAHRCDSSISIYIGIFDSNDRGLCNHLQGEYQFTVRFGLLGSNRYGIPEIFGREASFIDNRIDRLQPVVGPQNGIARLVLEIDDVEQILHVGRGFAAGGGAVFRRSVDRLEKDLQILEGLFDGDRMRIFSSRKFLPERPGSAPGSTVQPANSQNPKNSEKI